MSEFPRRQPEYQHSNEAVERFLANKYPSVDVGETTAEYVGEKNKDDVGPPSTLVSDFANARIPKSEDAIPGNMDDPYKPGPVMLGRVKGRRVDVGRMRGTEVEPIVPERAKTTYKEPYKSAGEFSAADLEQEDLPAHLMDPEQIMMAREEVQSESDDRFSAADDVVATFEEEFPGEDGQESDVIDDEGDSVDDLPVRASLRRSYPGKRSNTHARHEARNYGSRTSFETENSPFTQYRSGSRPHRESARHAPHVQKPGGRRRIAEQLHSDGGGIVARMNKQLEVGRNQLAQSKKEAARQEALKARLAWEKEEAARVKEEARRVKNERQKVTRRIKKLQDQGIGQANWNDTYDKDAQPDEDDRWRGKPHNGKQHSDVIRFTGPVSEEAPFEPLSVRRNRGMLTKKTAEERRILEERRHTQEERDLRRSYALKESLHRFGLAGVSPLELIINDPSDPGYDAQLLTLQERLAVLQDADLMNRMDTAMFMNESERFSALLMELLAAVHAHYEVLQEHKTIDVPHPEQLLRATLLEAVSGRQLKRKTIIDEITKKYTHEARTDWKASIAAKMLWMVYERIADEAMYIAEDVLQYPDMDEAAKTAIAADFKVVKDHILRQQGTLPRPAGMY
ncbi:MAG: hypothetical protein HOE53_01475 [Candidatus Magasanikbacteria bacterium]|jgi:hypothetical protein|nr:hypothetical protein [Candidatus Magasanikbacteria bacterium]